MLSRNFNIPVTVSLTSFPARINIVGEVIKSIMQQTVKPQRIVLWLAEEQFAGREADLPANLVELKKDGLEIMWCDDIRPHKKYFYTMQKYPDDIVITVDDDVQYSSDTIETLLESYCRYPFAVSALRAHRIAFDGNNNMLPYNQWERGIKTAHYPSHALIATGVCGVLYPPRCFGSEAFNKDFIKENCLNADDLWLKIMELIYNVPVVLAAPSRDVKTIKGSQDEALYKSNDLADNNDVQFRNILKSYDNFGGSSYSLTDRLLVSSAALENSTGFGDAASAVQIELLQAELGKIKSSFAYRFGQAVTFVPRCISIFANCINDNGFAYTVKLIAKKLRR